MVRLNLVLMVLLSLAVIGAAVALSISSGAPADRRLALEALVERLAHLDPEVAEEAGLRLKEMGPDALPILEKAASSGQEVVASRARRLLEEWKGPVPSLPVAPVLPEPKIVRFQLEAAWVGESVRAYVRLVNDSPTPMRIAWDVVRDSEARSRFAWFEIEGPDGRKIRIPAPSAREEAALAVHEIATGAAFDLYSATPQGAALIRGIFDRPGEFRIRFVYDATMTSEYRKTIPHPLLPAERITSNEVTVTVTAQP